MRPHSIPSQTPTNSSHTHFSIKYKINYGMKMTEEYPEWGKYRRWWWATYSHSYCHRKRDVQQWSVVGRIQQTTTSEMSRKNKLVSIDLIQRWAAAFGASPALLCTILYEDLQKSKWVDRSVIQTFDGFCVLWFIFGTIPPPKMIMWREHCIRVSATLETKYEWIIW